MPLTETQREAITNALAFIETSHGHQDGDIYTELAEALSELSPSDPDDFFKSIPCECFFEGRCLGQGEVGVSFCDGEVAVRIGKPGKSTTAYLNRAQLAALSAALAEASAFPVKL